MKGLVISFIIIFLTSCSVKIRTHITRSLPPLDYRKEVALIEITDKIPVSSIIIGSVKIGDSGFTTKCGWNIVIEQAKLEARKVGGNAIKITRHRLPSLLGSTCHRITATILKTSKASEFNIEPKKEPEEKNE